MLHGWPLLLAAFAAKEQPLNKGVSSAKEQIALDALRLKSRHNRNAQVAHTKGHGNIPSIVMFVHDPAECMYISRSLLTNGGFEPGLVGSIGKAMARRPHERFLDIGANIGTFALQVASAGYETVAIEPMGYNTELLAASRDLLGLSRNLTLFKSAVAAHPAAEPLCVISHEKHGNQGNGQLAPMNECRKASSAERTTADGGGASAPKSKRTARGAAHIETEVVRVSTVDELLAIADATRPHAADPCFAAAKIDVEGFELQALLGARSVFEGDCPPCMVLIEYVPYYNVSEVQGSMIGSTREASGSRAPQHNPMPLLHEQGYKCKRDASRHYRCYQGSQKHASRCSPPGAVL